jgi:hypothetical protein
MVGHVVHKLMRGYEAEVALPAMVFVRVDVELLLHHDMATIVMELLLHILM